MNTNQARDTMDVEVLPVIEHDGDRWRVLATGATDDAGRVFCHLASTTRSVKQRNGGRPIQICDWISASVLSTATGLRRADPTVDVLAVEIAPSEIWVAELSVSSNGMHEIRKGAINHRYRDLIGYGATYELAKAIAREHNDKIVADWRAWRFCHV